MKNLLLLILFFSLVGVAYYLEEYQKPKFEKTISLKNKLVDIDFDAIHTIELPNTRLLKKKNLWYSAEYRMLIDEKKITKLIDHLKGLDILRPIPEENYEDKYFKNNSHKIVLKSNTQEFEFIIGDVSELTGNFYVETIFQKHKKQLYLIKDTSLFEGFYQTELELYLNLYLTVKNLVLGDSIFYTDRFIFKDFDLDGQNIKTLRLDNKWNRWFELDFQKFTSIPNIPASLKYKDFKTIITNKIRNIEVLNIIPAKNADLTQKIATLEFSNNITWTFWGQSHEKSGIFLDIGSGDFVYQVNNNVNSLISSNIQDYWSKRFFYPDEKLLKSENVKFEIKYQKNIFKLLLPDLVNFDYQAIQSKSKKFKINKDNFNLLFNVFLGGTNFLDAKYYQKGIDKEPPRFAFIISGLNKNIKMNFYHDKISAYDMTDNYTLVFNLSLDEMGIKSFSDFIKEE